MAVDADATTLQEFLYNPHSPKADAFMKVELAHLLSGWKDVTDEGELSDLLLQAGALKMSDHLSSQQAQRGASSVRSRGN